MTTYRSKEGNFNPNQIKGLVESDIPHRVKGLLSRFYMQQQQSLQPDFLRNSGFITTAGEFATNICGRLLVQFIGVLGKVKKNKNPEKKYSDVCIKESKKGKYKNSEYDISDIIINDKSCEYVDEISFTENTHLKNHLINFFNLSAKNTAHFTVLTVQDESCIKPVVNFIIEHLEKEIYSKTDFKLYKKLGLEEQEYNNLLK